MIKIASGSRLLLFADLVERDATWPDKVAAAGGTGEALIVETLRYLDEPLCPGCLHGIEDDLPPAGAGLIVCPYCLTLVLAMRFAGEGHHVWYSFPWPR